MTLNATMALVDSIILQRLFMIMELGSPAKERMLQCMVAAHPAGSTMPHRHCAALLFLYVPSA